jgi:hypothetical protein
MIRICFQLAISLARFLRKGNGEAVHIPRYHTMKVYRCCEAQLYTFLILVLVGRSSSTDEYVFCIPECNKGKIDGTRSLCW